MSKKQKIIVFLVILVLVIIIAGIFIYFYATSHKNDDTLVPEIIENDAELIALLNNKAALQQADIQELEAESNQSDDILEESLSDPAIQDDEIPIKKAVKLMDIYSESGDTAVFKCFDNKAEAYDWEYYDFYAQVWTPADPGNVQAYGNGNYTISGLKMKAKEKDHEVMVRCTIHYPDKEDERQTASLFVLANKVKEIAIEDITVDANTYLCAGELPVKVTYDDGTSEIITGLNNLYFVTTDEKRDYATTVSGNRTETTTLITTESDCLYIGLEDKEELLRYHPDTSDNIIDTSVVISGKDILAPVISDVNISPYEVSSVDEAVTLSVSISADDNETPYPYLEYAFLYSDQELTEEDWKNQASFDVCIERNGTYIAYVRDRSGNIAQAEKEIITVDTKAPVITSVTLSNATGWCKSNTIIVNARDSGEMRYCFKNMTDGTYSDWISYNEYFIENNGTWMIQVQDAVGNISETEITIDNIDNEAPTIRNISIKE